MDTVCSWLALTFFPGTVGTTDDPWVILASGDQLADGSPLETALSQVVQSAPFPRASQPDSFNRGNARASLAFTKLVNEGDPRDATEAMLAHNLSLPSDTGWIRIQVDGKATEWSLDKVTFEATPARYSAPLGQIAYTYRFQAGKLAVYSGSTPETVYTPGEIAVGPTSDRGAILLGPNRTVS